MRLGLFRVPLLMRSGLFRVSLLMRLGLFRVSLLMRLGLFRVVQRRSATGQPLGVGGGALQASSRTLMLHEFRCFLIRFASCPGNN